MHDIGNKACGGKRAAILCRTGPIIERDINIVLFAFLPGGSGPFLEVLQYRASLEVWRSLNDALQIQKKPITLNSPSSSNPRPSIYFPSFLQLVGILHVRSNEVISHQFPWRRDCISCTPFLGQNNINRPSIDWQDLPLQCPNPKLIMWPKRPFIVSRSLLGVVIF